MFVAFVRWSLASVVLPALVNSVLVTGLTLYATRALGLYAWAWVLGILAGMSTGFLLCRLYNRVAGEEQ